MMFFAYFLSNTHYTDADLFDEETVAHNQLLASTLSFSQRNTANNIPLSSLFHTNGIQPNGFDLAAVRIKKEGKMTFKYRIHVEKITQAPLCEKLYLKVLYKGDFIYDGSLMNFVKDETIDATKPQDWIYFLSLPQNANAKAQTCDFTFTIKTWRDNPESKKGFYEEKVLTNSISSGL